MGNGSAKVPPPKKVPLPVGGSAEIGRQQSCRQFMIRTNAMIRDSIFARPVRVKLLPNYYTVAVPHSSPRLRRATLPRPVYESSFWTQRRWTKRVVMSDDVLPPGPSFLDLSTPPASNFNYLRVTLVRPRVRRTGIARAVNRRCTGLGGAGGRSIKAGRRPVAL